MVAQYIHKLKNMKCIATKAQSKIYYCFLANYNKCSDNYKIMNILLSICKNPFDLRKSVFYFFLIILVNYFFCIS